MARDNRVPVRLSDLEYSDLERLSNILHRNKSDTIRYLIKIKLEELDNEN